MKDLTNVKCLIVVKLSNGKVTFKIIIDVTAKKDLTNVTCQIAVLPLNKSRLFKDISAYFTATTPLFPVMRVIMLQICLLPRHSYYFHVSNKGTKNTIMQ
jgi:hypothetical protein